MCLAYASSQANTSLENHKSRVVSMSGDSLLGVLSSSAVGGCFGSCGGGTLTYITAFYSGPQKQRDDGDRGITPATRPLLWIHLRVNGGFVKWNQHLLL